MTRETFADPGVATLMNSQFINVKIDAEKAINKSLVEKYSINAYPTLVFVNSDGDMITKERGFKTTEIFEALSTEVVSKYKDPLLSKIGNSDIDDFSKEEIDIIISDYITTEFAIKKDIKKKILHDLQYTNNVSQESFEYLLYNYAIGDDYNIVFNSISKYITSKNQLELSMQGRNIFRNQIMIALDNQDEAALDQIESDYILFYDAFKTIGILDEPSKYFSTKRLELYAINHDNESYYQLADSMIQKYIWPHSAIKVKKQDKFTFNMTQTLRDSEKINEGEEIKELTLRDSLSVKFFNSLKLANRLNQITEHILTEMPEEDKLHKAAAWIDRSIEYVDLPESRIIKAGILHRLGEHAESKAELLSAKQSPYYDENCKEKVAMLELL
jgi:thiol-disulfide isomerase/thioredoxin